MKRINLSVVVFILMMVIAFVPVSSNAKSSSKDVDTRVAGAEEAGAKAEYQTVLDLLEPLESEKLDSADKKAKVNYLLGMARFSLTDSAMQAARNDKSQANDKLQQSQVDQFKAALENFEQVLQATPEGEIAPESMYMKGKILDWGYLQRFSEAMETYKAASERYPDTPHGAKAKERYEKLAAMFKSRGKGGIHGGFSKPKGSPHGGK